MKQLFRNYEVKNITVQLIFSITFSLSLTLFELIIFEIIGFLTSSSRLFYWRFSLVAILGLLLIIGFHYPIIGFLSLFNLFFTFISVMVVAVIPYYIAHSLISNIRFVTARYSTPITVILWIFYLYCFWRIGGKCHVNYNST